MIFTFNARDNVLWEVMTECFALSPEQLYNEINGELLRLKELLKRKDICYEDLKTALVPSIDRKELLLVFDSNRIKSGWYGGEIFEHVIPLFDVRSNHSVSFGDYIDLSDRQDRLFEMFSKEVELVRECAFMHSSQFFLIYINNMTDNMMKGFVEGLIQYEPFVGYADVTFSSDFKTYLSFIIGSNLIKNKKNIITTNEGEIDTIEEKNLYGYKFERNGYKCFSLDDMLYTTFLSYKIETPVYEGLERDVLFSINTITTEIYELKELDILVEEKKLEYLVNNKSGILKKAELRNITKPTLENLIRDKITNNYIFNLEHLKDSNTYKFNIMLEIGINEPDNVVKLQVALEYLPETKTLRLITLY